MIHGLSPEDMIRYVCFCHTNDLFPTYCFIHPGGVYNSTKHSLQVSGCCHIYWLLPIAREGRQGTRLRCWCLDSTDGKNGNVLVGVWIIVFVVDLILKRDIIYIYIIYILQYSFWRLVGHVFRVQNIAFAWMPGRIIGIQTLYTRVVDASLVNQPFL